MRFHEMLISKCIDAGIDTIEHGGALDEELLHKMKKMGRYGFRLCRYIKNWLEEKE